MKSNKVIFSNIVFNLIGKTWLIIANLAIVPIYIKYLGMERYGLITFFVILQTVVNVLGLGLSKTLRREFSKGDISEASRLYKYKIFRSTELIYTILSMIAVMLVFILKDFIVINWMNISVAELEYISIVVTLMGISIAIQLMNNLYLGCYYGLEKQIRANMSQSGWITIKYISGILVLIFSDNLIYLYICYILVDVLYLLYLRVNLLKLIEYQKNWIWSLKDLVLLKKIAKFALGILVISFGYTINTQVDKLIISSRFSLTIFGSYNTIFYLGTAITIFSSAIGIAIFPRFSKLFSQNNEKELNSLFLRINRSASILLIVVGIFMAVFSSDILNLWTGSNDIANVLGYTSVLVIFGTTLSSLQVIPYEYLLAKGITKYNNLLMIFSVLYTIIVMPILLDNYGVLGGGISWAILMMTTTIIYIYVILKIHIKNNIVKISFTNYFLPILISFTIASVCKYYITNMEINLFLYWIIILCVGLFSLGLNFYLLDKDLIKTINIEPNTT